MRSLLRISPAFAALVFLFGVATFTSGVSLGASHPAADSFDPRAAWAGSVGMPVSSAPGSFMEAAGLDKLQPEKIVLFSFNINLGDNILGTYSMINHLHREYPSAEIVVVSPTSGLLAKTPETPWFKPVQLDIGKFLDPGEVNPLWHDPVALKKYLTEEISKQLEPGALFISETVSLDLLRDKLIPRQVLSGRQDFKDLSPPEHSKIWAVEKKYIEEMEGFGEQSLLNVVQDHKSYGILVQRYEYFVGGPSYLPPERYGSSFYEMAPGLYRLVWYGRKAGTEALVKDRTSFYDSWNTVDRILFGSKFKAGFPPDLIPHRTPELIRQWNEFLARKGTSDPNRKFVLINLNTSGPGKLGPTAKAYPATLNRLVTRLARRHPECTLVIAPVESQYPKETKSDVEKLLARFHKRGLPVLSLPSDKKLWPVAASRADLVVSQDSGMVHIANLIRGGGDRVISFTTSPKSGIGWVMPGQAYYDLSEGSAGVRNEPARTWRNLYRAIDRKLGSAAVNPANCTIKALTGQETQE